MATGTPYNKIFNIKKDTNLESNTRLFAAEIKMLLTIPKYSLFWGNGIGIDFNKYKYLNNKTAQFNLIKSEIEALFLNYRRLSLVSISMEFSKVDSMLKINIQCTPNGADILDIPVEISVD